MSLPQNVVTTVPLVAPFLSPDASDFRNDQSLEQGGIAVNDPSRGLQYQDWIAEIVSGGTAVQIRPVGGGSTTTLVTGATNVTLVSLAFDINMQPSLAYTDGGVIKFRWYDTILSSFVTDSYPTATSCRLSTDDKRDAQQSVTDVILSYTRAGVLYWRQQRDRYTVEYTAGPAVGYALRRVGMTTNNRLCFELETV